MSISVFTRIKEYSYVSYWLDAFLVFTGFVPQNLKLHNRFRKVKHGERRPVNKNFRHLSNFDPESTIYQQWRLCAQLSPLSQSYWLWIATHFGVRSPEAWITWAIFDLVVLQFLRNQFAGTKKKKSSWHTLQRQDFLKLIAPGRKNGL